MIFFGFFFKIGFEKRDFLKKILHEIPYINPIDLSYTTTKPSGPKIIKARDFDTVRLDQE